MYRKLLIAGAFASLLVLPELAAAGLTLRQTVMSELRYDTNAMITPDGEQDSSDIVLQLGPDFEVTRDSEKLTLMAVYRPSFYYLFQEAGVEHAEPFSLGIDGLQILGEHVFPGAKTH